jgi:hypothetical protein
LSYIYNPVNFVVVGKLAQTIFPDGAVAVLIRSLPFETQAFQFLDTVECPRRFIYLSVQPVLIPLGSDPRTQLGVFAVAVRNIAVPVDFAIVGKLAQTFFPGGTLALPFETQAFQFLDTGECHRRYLSFSVQLVISPLIADPIS